MNCGLLSGLINGTEQLVYFSEVSGSASSLIDTGNILNGNEDGWYTIIYRHVGQGVSWKFTVNGDEGSNYGNRTIEATNTSVTDNNGTGRAGILSSGGGATSTTDLVVMRVYAKNGSARLFNMTENIGISSSGITSLKKTAYVWGNTADNIVSLQVSAATNGCGVGSWLAVLKANNFTNGTTTGIITTPYIKGTWVRLPCSTVLGADATSVTLSGLDGDRDVVYLLRYLAKAPSPNSGQTKLYLNNDTTSGNYKTQYLSASNSTITANRRTDLLYYEPLTGSWTAGNYAMQEMLIFAKQGFVRPLVSTYTHDINGVTVSQLHMSGSCYTVTNTNLTSLVLSPQNNGFSAGSQFSVYGLRPNG